MGPTGGKGSVHGPVGLPPPPPQNIRLSPALLASIPNSVSAPAHAVPSRHALPQLLHLPHRARLLTSSEKRPPMKLDPQVSPHIGFHLPSWTRKAPAGSHAFLHLSHFARQTVSFLRSTSNPGTWTFTPQVHRHCWERGLECFPSELDLNCNSVF